MSVCFYSTVIKLEGSTLSDIIVCKQVTTGKPYLILSQMVYLSIFYTGSNRNLIYIHSMHKTGSKHRAYDREYSTTAAYIKYSISLLQILLNLPYTKLCGLMSSCSKCYTRVDFYYHVALLLIGKCFPGRFNNYIII